MTERNTIASWEILFNEHRGTELGVLYALALQIGLRKGEITADDLRTIDVINGSVRGAVFKGLRRGGMFSKVGFVASKAEGRNGSAIAVWRLDKPSTARLILESFAGKMGMAAEGDGVQGDFNQIVSWGITNQTQRTNESPRLGKDFK